MNFTASHIAQIDAFFDSEMMVMFTLSNGNTLASAFDYSYTKYKHIMKLCAAHNLSLVKIELF